MDVDQVYIDGPSVDIKYTKNRPLVDIDKEYIDGLSLEKDKYK